MDLYLDIGLISLQFSNFLKGLRNFMDSAVYEAYVFFYCC